MVFWRNYFGAEIIVLCVVSFDFFFFFLLTENNYFIFSKVRNWSFSFAQSGKSFFCRVPPEGLLYRNVSHYPMMHLYICRIPRGCRLIGFVFTETPLACIFYLLYLGRFAYNSCSICLQLSTGSGESYIYKDKKKKNYNNNNTNGRFSIVGFEITVTTVDGFFFSHFAM